jgi:predicted protein tyrosine phosphatase
MTLILAQARPDLSAASIVSEVLRIRGKAWPNLDIIELGDALLGRNGENISAACLPDVYPNASPRRLLGPRHRTVQRTR